MQQTAERDTQTHTQHIKSRQVTSGKKWLSEKTHKTFHSICKFHGLRKIM